jgi:hypothetical protein
MARGIPGLAYGNIVIQPFQHEHDGILSGLVIEDGHGTDRAELYPAAGLPWPTGRELRPVTGDLFACTFATR